MQYLDDLITRLAFKCTLVSPTGGSPDYGDSVPDSVIADSDVITADSDVILTDTI